MYAKFSTKRGMILLRLEREKVSPEKAYDTDAERFLRINSMIVLALLLHALLRLIDATVRATFQVAILGFQKGRDKTNARACMYLCTTGYKVSRPRHLALLESSCSMSLQHLETPTTTSVPKGG